MNFQLDPDQLAALALINEGRNVFVTGSAGTGKSSLTVELIRRRLGDRTLKVTATTGVAALNLRDKLSSQFGYHIEASTIYRWAGIGIGPQPGQSFAECFFALSKRGVSWQGACSRIKGTSVLIIDEISMLPGKIFNFIDHVCREVRGSQLPFGGIQIITVGDFLQLPPVSKTGVYDWAFAANAWQAAEFCGVTLTKVHRQSDSEFVTLLNEFREGYVSKASSAILLTRVARFPSAKILRLFTHNAQVDRWNNYQLSDVNEEEFCFAAVKTGSKDQTDFLVKNLVTPELLRLKTNARIMVTANIRSEGTEDLAAANGEMGKVIGIAKGKIAVALDNGRELAISSHTWTFDPNSSNSGTFKQFPLRLGWAATIHKAQGLSLDAALIDIRAACEPGQAYVAISRVRSLAGLHLKDMFAGLWVSEQAKKFHRAVAAQKHTELPPFHLGSF